MRRPVGVKWVRFAFRWTRFFSRRVATDAILPSALWRAMFSLGACWAFSFQPVLPSDYRPVVLLLESRTCPNSLSKRLIQGECVPISSAIRLCGIPPKTSRNAFVFVRTRCSSCIWPDSSSTQYQLLRSPRSNPTVNFCCEIFLPGFAATVLTFLIAGLLFICALSTSITWERTASRPETGLLIPSANNTYGVQRYV